MAKEFAKSFYNSRAWKMCKDGYIKSRYGLCERCEKPGDIVHHKVLLTPENINNHDVSLNWEHLEYLCIDCHNKEHMGNHEEIIRDGLIFNNNGELVKAPT